MDTLELTKFMPAAVSIAVPVASVMAVVFVVRLLAHDEDGE